MKVLPVRFLTTLCLPLILFLSAACSQAAISTTEPGTPAAFSPTPARAETAVSSPTPEPPAATRTRVEENPVATVSPPAQITSTLDPGEWTSLPVVPAIDEPMHQRLQEIFLRGQGLSNNPRSFSKIGDCGSTPSWFLGDFDRGPRYYSLGEYTELKEVIGVYAGSFERTSLAAKAGFTTSSVLAPLWADRKQCDSKETPLECEYRLHRPSIALITLGTNDVWHSDEFEPQMRVIIETSLEQGVIPVLATKADNLEKDGSLNAAIARLAAEYRVPLWNYWLAVQPLPDQGLQEDGAHITWGSNHFDDPEAMEKGWTVRNLTALQVLDAIYQAVNPLMEEP